MKNIFVSVVIVCGGKSSRMGQDKLLIDIDGESVVEKSIKEFQIHSSVSEIVLVCGENINDIEKLAIEKNFDKVKKIILGGKTRAHSAKNGVLSCSKNADIIMVHDGARPYVSQNIINRLLSFKEPTNAIPVVKLKDTIKNVDSDGTILVTPNREDYVLVQTPQAFIASDITCAYKNASDNELFAASDDASLVEKAGKAVICVEGEYSNIKITTKDDIIFRIKKDENQHSKPDFLVGFGNDIHQLVKNRQLILGGVEIEHSYGLMGHSDADVILHAVIDSLLGALGKDDIGSHFPDDDDKYKDVDSSTLLKNVCLILKNENYRINNIDITISAQKPKLSSYRNAIREKVASILNINSSRVNIKFKTAEKLGYVGRCEGIKAESVVLLKLKV